jgi:hypothetical protein
MGEADSVCRGFEPEGVIRSEFSGADALLRCHFILECQEHYRVLTVAGALFILTSVIANIHIYFQPTTLFNTMVMLILSVGGFRFDRAINRDS